jgi:thiosulfate/3-mercaptopyruvate sulfurtransferase
MIEFPRAFNPCPAVWQIRNASGKIPQKAGPEAMPFKHPELLIEPDELARSIDDPNLRLFDATVFLLPAASGYRAESGLERYREGHIPGSAFMDLIRAFSDTSTGLGFSLPAQSALADAMGKAGIGADHAVVVYSSGHIMWATRAFWLLTAAGHRNVRVLNGGLKGYQAGGHALRAGEEHYPATPFSGTPLRSRFTDLAGMQAAASTPHVCTVNALSPSVYAGSGDMHYGRRGHIPGSRNVHYDALLDGDRFAAPEVMEAALAAGGMLSAPRVVTYCGGGISATVDAFACLLFGHPNVTVYDGSMAEWVRDPSLPLTVGAEP